MLKKLYLFRFFIILVLIYFNFYFLIVYPLRLSMRFLPLDEITESDKALFYTALAFYIIVSLPTILVLITYFIISFLLKKVNKSIISKIQWISIITLIIDSLALVIGSIIFEHQGAFTNYKLDIINALFNLVLSALLIVFSTVLYSKYNLKENSDDEKH